MPAGDEWRQTTEGGGLGGQGRTGGEVGVQMAATEDSGPGHTHIHTHTCAHTEALAAYRCRSWLTPVPGSVRTPASGLLREPWRVPL